MLRKAFIDINMLLKFNKIYQKVRLENLKAFRKLLNV